jgi:hypothetical protein
MKIIDWNSRDSVSTYKFLFYVFMILEIGACYFKWNLNTILKSSYGSVKESHEMDKWVKNVTQKCSFFGVQLVT